MEIPVFVHSYSCWYSIKYMSKELLEAMRDYEELSRKHFNKQAKIYDKTNTMLYSKYPKISCKDVVDYLKDKSFTELLDVGCGTGYFIDMLSKERNANYIGLDLSEEMIRVSQEKKIKQATFTVGYADKLPFADHSFDVVTCIQSFHHYPDSKEAMNEAYRVLKTGGLYILSDTGVGGFSKWLFNHITYKLISSGDCETDDRSGISEKMEHCGFKVIRCEQIQGKIYTVVGIK